MEFRELLAEWKYIFGYSFNECAEILGCSDLSVKRWLYKDEPRNKVKESILRLRIISDLGNKSREIDDLIRRCNE